MDVAQINQEKQSFFILFNTLLKNGPLFGFENRNIQEALEKFFRHKQTIFEAEGDLQIRFGFSNLRINDQKVPLDNAVGGILNKLAQECETFCLNLLSFQKDMTAEELGKFILYFHEFQKTRSSFPSPESAYEAFINGWNALNITSIHCGRTMEVSKQAIQEELDDATLALRIYFRTCMMVREMIHNFAGNEKFQQRKMKTLIKNIIESLQKDSYHLLALTHSKYFQQDIEIFHLTNTGIFSALIGLSLDIPRSDLADLILCAFLHDIGSTTSYDHIQSSPEEFLSQCRKKDSHSLKKIATLFQSEHIPDSILRSVIVAVECHFKEKLQNAKRSSLFSRIIEIASDYDRLVTRNPYTRNYKCSPQEALNYLHTHSKNRHLEAYDSALYKIFFQVMGLFPIGSLVQLSNGSFGIIVAQQEDLSLSNQPFVRVFADPTGNKIESEVVDLSQEDSLGPDRFKIQKVVSFEALNLTLEEYLKIITG